jgi:hypothetical protein
MSDHIDWADETGTVRMLLDLNRQSDFVQFGGRAVDDPDHWTIGPAMLSRDSCLRVEVNFEELEKALEAASHLEGEWEMVRCSHWAVGWLEHLSFRVIDEAGKVTPMYRFVADWFESISEGGCANEDELTARKHAQCLRWISMSGQRHVEAGAEEWQQKVYQWLLENESDQVEDDDPDGNGACPDDDAVLRAIRALGIEDND